jgi:hypothetical protein
MRRAVAVFLCFGLWFAVDGNLLAATYTPPAPQIPASPIFPQFSEVNALEEEGISPAEVQQLERGQIVIQRRSVPADLKGTNAAAIALVRGSVEEIMSVVLDCESQPQFVPHLVECRNEFEPGATSPTSQYRQFQRLRIGWGFLYKELTYTNRMFRLPPYVSGWEMIAGDLEQSAGYWRIIPYRGEKQILVYNVFHQPGMAVPTWVQDILLNKDLPRTVEAFRDRVEAKRPAAR